MKSTKAALQSVRSDLDAEYYGGIKEILSKAMKDISNHTGRLTTYDVVIIDQFYYFWRLFYTDKILKWRQKGCTRRAKK